MLARIDAGQEQGDRVLPFSERDIIDHSPVSLANLAKGGLPVLDLAAAAVSESDNTAANLLLDAMGGPASLTEYLRSLGDQVTRLDRMEPQGDDGGCPLAGRRAGRCWTRGHVLGDLSSTTITSIGSGPWLTSPCTVPGGSASSQ